MIRLGYIICLLSIYELRSLLKLTINLRMKILLYACMLLLSQAFFSSPVLAQSIPVTGKVNAKTTGEPLGGATVSIKGTSNATTTDVDGNFQINVPNRNVILVISYVGMTSQEVAIPESGNLVVQLVDVGPGSLDEVVVVGYGTQRKSVVTGAISSVKARDLENVPSNRIEQALQGRVAGVTIAQNNGQPGSPSTIRIRGLTTFGDGGNNPLWVVRSEERRVGKECRCRWSPHREKR